MRFIIKSYCSSKFQMRTYPRTDGNGRKVAFRRSVKMEAELFVFALFTTLVIVDGALSSPEDIEDCVGKNVTIPWNYDYPDNTIGSVIWRVNTTTDIMTYFGSGGPRNPQNGYNVIAANNFGSITITNAQRSNTGEYQIVVTTSQAVPDQVDLIVCEAASDLKGTKTELVMQCAANLGEPEAQLYIKVNGKTLTSSSATVKDTDKVECCLSGCAAKCMRDSNDSNEFCKNVQKCECPLLCILLAIFSILFGSGGAGVLCCNIFLIKKGFSKKKILQVVDMVDIVAFAISIILDIIGLTNGNCKECCLDDDDKWVKNVYVAFLVISTIGAVADIIIFLLLFWDKIGPGRKGGNDGGNNGGRGHGGGHGTNSNTVHTRREDTHRGTLSDRANSDGEVSRKDVHVQENRDNFSGRPMPPIPLTDKKGRGLSANYDDDHPMITVGIPDKRAGDLGPLDEEPRKKKKKKRKQVNDDDDE